MKTTNEVATGHGIVLTHENAKKFATRLKKTLKENSIDFKTSKCYDILAKTFGSSNWHELSQHLSTNENINNNPLAKSTSSDRLNSIFDLPWVEFKYIISKITTYLEFDFYTKEFLDILLDIVHENQPRSEIYWEKLTEIFNGSERNFRSDIEYMPIYDYTAILNPTLTKEQIEQYLKKVTKSGSVRGEYRIRFSPEKVEAFFNMLQFLKNENFILRDLHTNFAISEVLYVEEYNYKSNYPFISSLIKLADINNDYIEYNSNYYKTLTFHDLIINLYSRTSLLNHVRINNPLEIEIKEFTKEIFENNQFVSYLFSHLKTYVFNSIEIKKEHKIEYNVEQYPQGINKMVNIIQYNMNYIPHGFILKYNLENINMSQFEPRIKNPENNEVINDFIDIKLDMNIHDKTMLVYKNKSATLKHLRSESFQPKFNTEQVILFSNY